MSPEDRDRLLAEIRAELAEALDAFVQTPALQLTPEVEKRIKRTVARHLTRVVNSWELTPPMPEVEVHSIGGGVVTFELKGDLDPRLHAALYRAGLVEQPPLPDYIEINMTLRAGDEEE